MADNVSAGLFDRGKTRFMGTPASISGSVVLEGVEQSFQDVTSQYGPDQLNSGRKTVCRIVRNVSGIALLPKRTASWKSGYRGRRVDGYVTVTNGEPAGVVDDQLPAAGVANNDLFWLMRKGPGLCLNDIAAGASTPIDEGDTVGALTAVTSQATTAGRIRASQLTGATTPLATGVLNRIGRAMSARTTANTNADVLVDLDVIS